MSNVQTLDQELTLPAPVNRLFSAKTLI